MIDVHELLRKKEDDIDRVRREIHALQLVAPMLSDSDEVPATPSHHYPEMTDDAERNGGIHTLSEQAAVAGESSEASSDPIPPKRGILRDWLSRASGE